MKTNFVTEQYIIMDMKGNFVYGECEGEGKDFELAQKFNEFNDATRFINHNRQYDNEGWKVFRVIVNSEIEIPKELL